MYTTTDIGEKRRLFEAINGVDHPDVMAQKLTGHANQAFSYWCRVARWISKNWRIGMPLVNSQDQAKYGRFVILDPLAHLYSTANRMTVEMSRGMPLSTWKEIGQALSENLDPPVWFDFLCEARDKRENGDHKAAVIDSAICVETLLRNRVFEAVLSIAKDNEGVAKYVDDWNVNGIISNLDKLSTTKNHELSKSHFKQLRKLFAARNDIMHRGRLEIAEADSKSAIDVAAVVGNEFGF